MVTNAKQKHRVRARRGRTPLWAIRLAGALQHAGITDKKGNVDKKLAGLLFNVGPKTIESWITGRTQPRFEKLMKVREITKVSLDWIIIERPIPEAAAEPTILDEPVRVMKPDNR